MKLVDSKPSALAFQTGPVVVEGVMYATTLHDTFAIDASTWTSGNVSRIFWGISGTPTIVIYARWQHAVYSLQRSSSLQRRRSVIGPAVTALPKGRVY